MSYFTRYTLDIFRDDTPAFIPEPICRAIQQKLQTLYADASPCLRPFDPSAYFYDDENDMSRDRALQLLSRTKPDCKLWQILRAHCLPLAQSAYDFTQ